MDLRWTDEEEAFRAEARAWLEENLARWRHGVGGTPASGDTAAGFAQHRVWEQMLFEARWAVVSWPVEYGGRAATPWEWLIFEEEYYRAGGPPRITQNGIFLLAPTLFEAGTPEQQDRILPRMAAALDLWCQGWSEPDAGSDLAGLRSTARQVDGGWVLDGQKTWTTRGAFCTHLFGLFRTDPDQERHRGLTYLLVPLDTPGVTVRGFGRLDGDEGFAEVFFEEAFLPDEGALGAVVLGGVGQGWRVAMATTSSERGLTLRAPGRFTATADRLVELWRSTHGATRVPHLRDRLIAAWMRAEAYRVQTLEVVSRTVAGRPTGAATSMVKLWWSELDVELHEIALDLLGTDAELESDWSKGWQFALSGPIYAGTNEIQRNITAERVLGLPRAELDFTFSELDEQFREGARGVLEARCTPATIRAAWEAEPGMTDRGAWDALAAMGVLDALVPEAQGGLGLDERSLVLVFQEAGRAGLPDPLVETAALAAPLLGPHYAGSGAVVASDLGTHSGHRRGDARIVPWAADADLLLLEADDGTVHLLEPGAVRLDPETTVDGSRRAWRVRWERGPSTGVDATPEAVAAARERATLATAAELVGLAERMLEMTVAYVSQRRQFGVPVGSFQAVKHHLADVAVQQEFARPVVYRAAWSLATAAPEALRDVSMAKAMASEAALLTGRAALQCHGAIGYTIEHDLHLFLKRTWALARAFGDPAHHRARVGGTLGV